jgi:uncharacterized membrane protein
MFSKFICLIYKELQKARCNYYHKRSSWNFSAIDKPLFYILLNEKQAEADYNELRKAFVIGNMRYFHEDPRFGLITLSEIASRALSRSQ